MKRREFVKQASLATAGLMLMPKLFAAEATTLKDLDLGIQIYTIRDAIFKDPKGELKKIAAYGYKKIEAFAYRDGKIFGMTYKEFDAYIRSLGMSITSGHYGIDQVRNNWEKAIEDAKSIDQPYMVCPYLVEGERKTIDDYKRRCEEFNKAGELCNKYGIRFGYHNHAFEYTELEGKLPIDVMMSELDPKLVSMEMDIYWVVNAGQDPIAFFNKYPGRFEQWHVKDMSKEDRSKNADVGTGSIDFKALFALKKLSGMKHFYVEQESYPGLPMDSVGKSAANLLKML